MLKFAAKIKIKIKIKAIRRKDQECSEAKQCEALNRIIYVIQGDNYNIEYGIFRPSSYMFQLLRDKGLRLCISDEQITNIIKKYKILLY